MAGLRRRFGPRYTVPLEFKGKLRLDLSTERTPPPTSSAATRREAEPPSSAGRRLGAESWPGSSLMGLTDVPTCARGVLTR